MKKLFIIVFLLLNFQSIFSQQISKDIEQTLWKYIDCKFVYASKTANNYTWTFPRDIAIKLGGNVGREDSLCFNELIAQIKSIIPKRKIYLTPGEVCLVFNFINTAQLSYSPVKFYGDIYFHKILLNIPKDLSIESRKKIIYYNLYRSLVYFNVPDRDCIPLEGCVFSETDPLKISYSPYDSYILGKLYAKNFWDQYNDKILKNANAHSNLIKQFQNEYRSLLYSFGLLVGFVLLIVLLAKGAFKMRRRSWLEYNRIGLYLIVIGFICIYFLDFGGFWIVRSKLTLLFSYIFRSFAAINIIYFAEYFLYRKSIPGGVRLFLIFLITLSVPFLVYMPDFEHFKMDPPPWGQTPLYLTGACLRVLYIFLNDRYNSMINQKDVQLARINELHKRVQLQTLQAKINPHFLYNALNSIASLATTDAKKTEQMALSLSDFFKYSINREQKQLNSLSEELNAIRTYLEIEKVRFGERLNYEIDCPEELLNIQIPQLLVQPLVENAVKHGLSQITGKGLIKISVSKVGNEVKIRVDDNGPAFPDGPLTGYGIKNTNERIRLMYGKKASINWYNGDEKCIELSFPMA